LAKKGRGLGHVPHLGIMPF